MVKKKFKQKRKEKVAQDPAAALTPWEAYQKQQQRAQKKSKLTIEKKLPRLKKLRRKNLMGRLAFLLTLFGVVLLTALYFVSPLSHVGLISVSADKHSTLAEQKVIDASGIKSSDLVLGVLLHQDRIEKRMHRREPKIKEVTFKVHGLRNVELKLKTYKTMGLLMRHERYYPILENGAIASDSTAQPVNNHSVYRNFKAGKKLQQMIKQYRQLPTTVRNSISEIQFSPTKLNPQRVHLYMNDGNQVYATVKTFAKKMRYYPDIAKEMQKKGTVNLEVGAYSYPF